MRTVRGIGLRGRSRYGAAVCALVGAGLVAGMVLAGATDGYPQQRPNMTSGAAWLVSDRVGQLTLLDGTSAEVAAQVQVAPAGHDVTVVQQGATAYAVDQTAGTLRRVDGATFDLSHPATPIPGAAAGLTAFAGPNTVYALDTQRGLLTATDPRTLAPIGLPQSLATQLASGTAVLDGNGTLWLIDDATGDLTWIAGDQRHTRRQVAAVGHNVLTLVDGAPVVVDPTNRRAVAVNPRTGATIASVDLDLRPGDTLQVSGSPHSDRLYLVSSRGVLNICELASTSCDRVVPLRANPGQLGEAVEAADRVFVPDYTTGSVWVVDLTHNNVIATPQVLTPPVPFQLLNKDGVVFYNDPGSDRAGVIRLDGKVTSTAKYDPGNPNAGLHIPGSAGRTTPSAPNPPAGSPTTQQNQPSSQQQPTNQPPNQQQPPNQPPFQQAGVGVPPTSGSTPPTSGSATPPTLRITVSKTNPTVNEDVTLQVSTTTGATPTEAQWDFGDGQTGSGVTVTHHWSTARTYQVSVTATTADGQQATTSVSITVSPVPTVILSVSIINPGGSVNGGGISCPGTCSVSVPVGTVVTLTEQPGAYYTFTNWSQACTGTGPTCTVTMNSNSLVRVAFNDTAAPEDCVGYNPTTLSLQSHSDGTFTLTDGSSSLNVLDNQSDANNALTIARAFDQQCFVGRGGRADWIMQYWKGGSGTTPPVSGTEDCLSYDPNNLTIVQVTDPTNGTWYSLRDGGSLLEAAASQAGAVRELRVLQQYTKACFLGRSNTRTAHFDYVFDYFR